MADEDGRLVRDIEEVKRRYDELELPRSLSLPLRDSLGNLHCIKERTRTWYVCIGK